ncbi:MAG: lipid asymmetry maintenance protein MlaB [Sulfurifustaceae bacterium]
MQLINLTCHADRTEVHFEGGLDVSHAVVARERLTEALVRSLPLELEAARLERLDGAFLQLLVAFQRAAKARGLRPRWRSVSPVLRSAAEALGLIETLELPA